MWHAFETRVPGKWVLAGEHSVLRGSTAVAMPHPEFGLTLRYEPGTFQLEILPEKARPVVLELLNSIKDDLESKDRSFTLPSGRISVESSIPNGAGLGSSAALCVAIARWLRESLGFADSELFEFARSLEHRFHGRSSGMDIAVASQGCPISFAMNRGAEALKIKKIPNFTFHDTGLRARTSDCVIKVEVFREETPFLGMKADEAMGVAARKAIEGLVAYDVGNTEAGLDLIAYAIKQAQECFYTWQLVPEQGKRLEESLLRQGALACKMTGAGGGGFIVALWPDGVRPEEIVT